MSKKLSKKTNIERKVMSEVISERVKMKPKWYFVAGSALLSIGIVCSTVGAIFLTNLTFFLLNKRGLGYGKITMLLSSFPVWVPVFAVAGIAFGIILLRKYDFSYKRNFLGIIIIFIASVIFAGILIDKLGLNDAWSTQGPMRGFYRRLELQNNSIVPGREGRVKGKMR